MDVFVNYSWQLLAKFEIYCGLWPFQSRLKNYMIRAVFIVLVITGVIPIAARIQKEWGVNYHIATENIGAVMMTIGISLKVIMASVCSKERQTIYEQVNHHFRTITDEQEAFLLNKLSKNGKKFVIKYMIIHFMIFTIFFTLPVAVMIFRHITRSSEIENLFPYYADYNIFIDEDKYYVLVILHMLTLCFAGAGMNCTYDFTFVMSVRHICALFEIVKIRVQGATGFLDECEWDMLDYATANNQAYKFITKAIDLHNEALEMVPLIEETYNLALFVVLVENAFAFSVGTYLFLFSFNHPLNFLRYFTYVMGLLVHFYLQFSHGQLIIDSSSSVFDACYKVKWYLGSTKTRRLLSIMMSRSSRPCKITGGRLFIISMETCSKMLKAGFSFVSIFTRRMS